MSLAVGSCFSGCGGLDLGLEQAGFSVAWQIEWDGRRIDVLRYHWPEIPKLGDIREVPTDELAPVRLVAGGSPCQDLSVAGKREGLDGERSGLFHQFVRIADSQPSAWVLWENVDGALSSNEGRDFGIVLRELTGFWPSAPAGGWRSSGVCVGPKRWAVWRVLDSEYFGVPQRRYRIFLVGGPRDGACAPEVLLEPDCLPGNPPPSRETGAGVAGALMSGAGERGSRVGADEAAGGHVVSALTRNGVGASGPDDNQAQAGHLLAHTFSELGESHATYRESATAMALRTGGGGALSANLVAHTLRGVGFDASEDGTGRDTPIVVAAYCRNNTSGALDTSAALTSHSGRYDFESETLLAYQCHGSNVGPMGTVRAGSGGTTGGVPFLLDQQNCRALESGVCGTLQTNGDNRGFAVVAQSVTAGYAKTCDAAGSNGGGPVNAIVEPHGVRRLTPRECERLQGYQDDWTRYGRRENGTVYELKDSPRYAMVGDGVTATAGRWIGRRLRKALSPEVAP